MKQTQHLKSNTKSCLWIALLFTFTCSFAQNNSVTIGGNNTNNKAVLWLVPNGGQGLLLPNINSSTRTGMNVQTTDAGMVVFDSDLNVLFYWSGTTWISLSNNGTPVVTMNGDVTGQAAATVVQAIQGNKVQAVTPSDQQVLKWNNADKQWEPSADNVGPTYTQGTGISISNNIISVASGTVMGQVLTWNGTAWAASTTTITETDPTVKAINGIVKSNGTTVSAAGASDISTTLGSQTANTFYAAPSGSNGTPSFRTITATDVPTLNQNTTGTASNITATSNSTLATLSSLSLPYSQLSGTVPTWNQNTTGTASNITATSNSTLTTLSALSLPVSQLSGTLPMANGGTGTTSVTANTLIKGNAAGTAQTASQIFDNGTNVGIGTNTPQEKLDVNGATLLEQITAPTTTTNRLYNVNGNLFWNGTNISSNGWSLTGNNGTNPATNFLGTLDTAALVFKVNNVKSGKIESKTNGSTFFGYGAGINNMANTGGVGIGASALASNTTGVNNTASGAFALQNNTTGYSNTASGAFALQNNTTGYSNTASGILALFDNTTGYSNTASGDGALLQNTTGINNTAIGNGALGSNTTGSNNTAIGNGTNVISGSLINATAIGANAAVGASNSLVLGSISGINGATANTNVGIGTTTPQEKLDLTDGVFHLGQTTTPTTTTDRLYNVSGNLFWNGNNISSNGWSMTGNNGTNPAINFLGTIDAQPLIFRANNTEQMRIDGTIGSVVVNYNSAEYPPNTTNGNYKFVAYNGGNHPALGIDNFGVKIGDINGDSFSNYFYTDFESGGNFQFMNGNVGIGTITPSQPLDVTGNVKFSGALMPNNAAGTSGYVLTSAGTNTSPTWTDPTSIAWGLSGNSVSSSNFLGTTNGIPLYFKVNNTASGQISSSGPTFLGYQAGLSNTDATATGVGIQALNKNTSGTYNTAFGSYALAATVTGGYNTAVGNRALTANTGGSNTAVGTGALLSNTSGNNSTGVGVSALHQQSTGGYNTAMGYNAGYNITSTNYNICVGYEAGYNYALGSSNVIIGPSADHNAAGYDNTIVIGSSAQGTASNQITLGNGTMSSLRCAVTSITSLSDQRDKKNIQDLSLGLDFIMNLKPRQFQWDKRDWYSNHKSDSSKVDKKFTAGFIAQELDETQGKFNAEWLNLVYKANPEKWEATYGNLLPVIISAMQEQQTEIEELKTANKKLEDRLAAIEALLQNGNGQFNLTSSTTMKASTRK